jgi:hypothetical protein
LAERFRVHPPAYTLPKRPDLPWEACTASSAEMEKFRQVYLTVFAAEWHARQ